MSSTAIVDGILEREGWPAFTDHPWDKGGPTKGGITLDTLRAYLGLPVTVADLKAMPKATAIAIYMQRYAAPYATVPEPLRTLLVDIAVTSWHDDAARYLQRVLRKRGLYQARIDGVLGPKTQAGLRELVQRHDLRRVFIEIVQARSEQLAREAIDDPAVQQFLREHRDVDLHNLVGWINRSVGLLDLLT